MSVTKKDVNSDSNGLSYLQRVDQHCKTRRPQPGAIQRMYRVPLALREYCNKNKEVEVIQICYVRSTRVAHKHIPGYLKLSHKFSSGSLLGTDRFGNDHVALQFWVSVIFQWGNLLSPPRVYFREGLGTICSHWQFCDSDLSGIQRILVFAQARATSLQVMEKSKRASHPPKPVPNSKQRLHLLHMDLCGPMRIASIIGKRYVGDWERLLPLHLSLQSKDKENMEQLTAPDAQAPQALHTPTATTTTADTAPTPTNSSSQATNCPNSSQDVDELETQQHGQHQPATTAENVPNALFDENTFVNPFATPSTSDAEPSSSQYVDPSNMHTFYQPYPHEFQWTKDHPLEQVIGEPSRPVLTRNQLRSDGDSAYNIKPLTLKWLFKNKHDEENTVIRNKSRLVVRGYRQEEGIDFEDYSH
ncbi:retrovirus-related pol polyprotein from transposon TNT 1-94 [Tanacetum coccineum]|uniref:Retrovirus-related pol polyprotein from transposon TNT 1-94 n=1 Tax=Tanacetum coccineum TaxID=301880 RepID=A0ABQ5BLK7_9ASTR